MTSLGSELGLSEETVQRIIGDDLNVHLITVFTYGLYTIIFIVTIRHIGIDFVQPFDDDN